jgi:prepilin-type N-terminal cleavage/methylation domain-containing protein
MEPIAIRDKLNNKGMTLIEMLIALTLLLITSLAMMQTSLLAIQTNLVNSLRDEAVNVAELRMNELRNLQFDSLTFTGATGVVEAPITRNIRAASFSFGLRRTVADINLDTKQVTVTVTWSYKSVPYTHSITTILRAQS